MQSLSYLQPGHAMSMLPSSEDVSLRDLASEDSTAPVNPRSPWLLNFFWHDTPDLKPQVA